MKTKRLKILIVESNPVIRRRFSTWTVQLGYSLYECDNINKTMALVRRIKPDIVIMNIKVKEQNTLNYAEIITSEKLANVILTSFKNEDYVAQQYDFIRSDATIVIFEEAIKNTAKRIHSFSISREGKNEYISKAQIILMKKYLISEEQAYRFIQKRSMDNALKMEVIAKQIIEKIG